MHRSADANRDRGEGTAAAGVTVVETPRLVVRRLTLDDGEFILELFNDPAFIRHVGDKKVRSAEDARAYLAAVPLASYRQHGFGHYLVELKETAEPIGICSLVKRDWLEDVDLGFAFLPGFRRKGYAFESAAAVRAYAREAFGLERLVAITSRDNAASIGLLETLGFAFERLTRSPDGDAELNLYAWHA